MEWVLPITSLFLLLPIYTQLRLYRMTKSTSYLYLALVFAAVLSNRIISIMSLTNWGEILVFDTLFVIIHFPLAMVANQYLERDEKKSLRITSAGFGVVWLIFVLMLILEKDTYWIKSFGRLGIAIYVMYSILSLKRIVNTPRVKVVKVLLFIVSVLLVVNAGIYFIPTYPRDEIQMISDLVVFGVSTILFILALFFPETMLVTKVQLAAAIQLYDLIEKEERKKTSFAVPVSSLLEYLTSFAEKNSSNITQENPQEDSL